MQSFPSAHTLALLFMIFALGSLAKADQKSSELYHIFACASVSLRSVDKDATLHTFLAIFLMALHEFRHGCGASFNRRWTLLGLCSNIAFRLGLHKDATELDLGEEELCRRKAAYWEFQYWNLCSVK
jgi:hypothetical protein